MPIKYTSARFLVHSNPSFKNPDDLMIAYCKIYESSITSDQFDAATEEAKMLGGTVRFATFFADDTAQAIRFEDEHTRIHNEPICGKKWRSSQADVEI